MEELIRVALNIVSPLASSSGDDDAGEKASSVSELFDERSSFMSCGTVGRSSGSDNDERRHMCSQQG